MFKIIKITLIIIIVTLLSLVLLELCLQRFYDTIKQDNYNNEKFDNKTKYTIMCLGESTTQGQYPIQLQDALDKKYPNQFSVFDCGINGGTLKDILKYLDDNIIKYKPNIVICMMGIGDGFIDLKYDNKKNIKYDKNDNINLKVYKIFIYLKNSIKNFFADNRNEDIKELDSSINYFCETKYKMDINLFYYFVTKNLNGYYDKELYYFYYVLTKDLNGSYYDKLKSYLYLLKFFINGNQTDDFKFLLLQNSLLSYPLCNQVDYFLLDENEKNISLKKILSMSNKEYHKAKLIFDERDYIRFNFPKIETYNLYKLIIKKLIDKNIKVICMQYPLISIDSLKNQLKNEEYFDKITFISNEQNFKEALIDRKYIEIFEDQFAGDFGHCTRLGNKMIARNVVKTLENLMN